MRRLRAVAKTSRTSALWTSKPSTLTASRRFTDVLMSSMTSSMRRRFVSSRYSSSGEVLRANSPSLAHPRRGGPSLLKDLLLAGHMTAGHENATVADHGVDDR